MEEMQRTFPINCSVFYVCMRPKCNQQFSLLIFMKGQNEPIYFLWTTKCWYQMNMQSVHIAPKCLLFGSNLPHEFQYEICLYGTRCMNCTQRIPFTSGITPKMAMSNMLRPQSVHFHLCLQENSPKITMKSKR